ncbi:MAG: hypothetical protein MUC87_19410 [Bacteroidia bacterium]|nr:hypothetical protein [Bacteroidia bacterium]
MGQYFEQKTFNWIKLSEEADGFKASYIQSLDEGDELNYDVTLFSTVDSIQEDVDVNEPISFTGSLYDCIQWIKLHYATPDSKFIRMNALNEVYLQLVREGMLGN